MLSSQKKSQTAIEFLILIGTVLFFFTSFYIAIGTNIHEKTKESLNRMASEIVYSVQDEINLASQSTDGYYREFKIPTDINEIDYNITILENMVYLKTYDGKYAIAVPVPNVTGNITKGENRITKKNQTVYLNLE